MEPEEAEVCLRYILKHAKRRGSRNFEIFDTKEQNDHLVASRRRSLEHQGERVALQERWQKRLARHKVRSHNGKGPSVPRKKDENAVAAAKFFFEQGGRKPVEFCGR